MRDFRGASMCHRFGFFRRKVFKRLCVFLQCINMQISYFKVIWEGQESPKGGMPLPRSRGTANHREVGGGSSEVVDAVQTHQQECWIGFSTGPTEHGLLSSFPSRRAVISLPGGQVCE